MSQSDFANIYTFSYTYLRNNIYIYKTILLYKYKNIIKWIEVHFIQRKNRYARV